MTDPKAETAQSKRVVYECGCINCGDKCQCDGVCAESRRKSLAAAWSAYLDVALHERLDDGTPVLEVVFAHRPDLRDRLAVAMRIPPASTDGSDR